MDDDFGELVATVGNLFSRVQELKCLLHRMSENQQCQGELHLTHTANNGVETPLVIHIDGTDFMMLPADQCGKFRVEVSGLSIWFE